MEEVRESHQIRAFFKRIHQGDDRAVEEIYKIYKHEFLNWASSNVLSHEDLLDIWQDSVIVFYEQVVSGKLKTLEVQLKTYLFAIGKNKIAERLRKLKSVERIEKQYLTNSNLNIDKHNDYLSLGDHEQNPLKISMEKALKSLSQKEQDILIDRYYSGLSLEAIQIKRQYKTINTVNATISRAIKNLKKIAKAQQNKLPILLSFLF